MSKDLSKKNGQILTKFTPMQLESALAYAENIMESLPIDFFVLDDLSEFLVKNSPDEWLHDLEDISIGVRKHWVTKNVLSTLETVVKDLVIIPGEWQFNSYENVPIRVTIVQKNYSYLQNLDTFHHLASQYLIPNPFNKYWAGRYLIK